MSGFGLVWGGREVRERQQVEQSRGAGEAGGSGGTAEAGAL